MIVAKALEVTRRLHVPDTITPQNRQRKREVRKPGSFTDRYIKSLKPDKEMYQLREGRGFAIRVLPSGVKTWYYIYTINGKRRQLNLGNYPDISLEAAHKTYLESAALVKSGIDPMAKPVEETAEPAQQEVELTVRRLAVDLYLDEWSKIHHSERWHYNNRKALEADILPVWGVRLAVDIRRKDAVEILELVAKRAPGQARNVLKAARGMYSYAVDRELLEYNPFADIKISRTIPMMQPMSRDRELSEDEIRHLWKAIDEGGGSESTKRALKLILVTGQRPGEVVGMHRREIQGKWWTIPWQRIKTRKRRQEDHRIYLTPLAMSLIGDEKEYIFPDPAGKSAMTENALSHHVRKDIPDTVKRPYYDLPRWTPHDLRRTAATRLSKIGASDEVIDVILNHAKKGVSGIYNRNKYDNEKQLWLTKWSQHLSRLLKKKQPAAKGTGGRKSVKSSTEEPKK